MSYLIITTHTYFITSCKDTKFIKDCTPVLKIISVLLVGVVKGGNLSSPWTLR